MKILLSPVVFNEEAKIGPVLKKCKECGILKAVDLMVLDDGSTDGSRRVIESEGVAVLRHPDRMGVGAAIRSVTEYGQKNGYDVVVIMSGSGKSDPAEVWRLIKPILKEGYDLVQGSRYLPGGRTNGMPLYRQIATRFVHPFLFSLFVGRRVTDSTSGFRAIRLSILKDARINLRQQWLNQYELEPYLLYKAITLGYRVVEAPMTITYPPRGQGYTKMKPFVSWWSILRPLFLLASGLKK